MIRLICDNGHAAVRVEDLTDNGPFGWGPAPVQYNRRAGQVSWGGEPADRTRSGEEWMKDSRAGTHPAERYKFECPACRANVPVTHRNLQAICPKLMTHRQTILALSDLRVLISQTNQHLG